MPADEPTGGPRPLRTYGRGKGRPLSGRQQRLVDELLPRLALPAGEGPLDLAALFPGAQGVRLEIGFGGGEHMIAQAQAHPALGFLGAEPFLDGVAKALAGIEERGLANIRLHRGDARDVLPRLAPASLARIDILFPDPWPKARHGKRRLVAPETIAALARVLAPGGELRIATDWAAYAEWILIHVRASPAFDWTARRPQDWRLPPSDHVTTRYEQKRLGDIGPVFLRFRRR